MDPLIVPFSKKPRALTQGAGFTFRHKDIEKYSLKIFNALNFLQQLDEIMRGTGKIVLSIKARERLTAPLRGLPQRFASISFILALRVKKKNISQGEGWGRGEVFPGL
jgi:hypothetical protein